MARFDLKIIPIDDGAVLLADSPFGEATTTLPRPFLDEMLKRSRRLRELYSDILRHPKLDISPELRRFGTDLFRGIFVGDVQVLFHRTIGGSDDGELDIRLMPGNNELNGIQWEIMRDRDEFVGFRHNLVRHPFVSRPVRVPRDSKRRLNVLVVAVDPIYDERTVRREHEHVTGILGGFGDQIRLTSLYQSQATLDNIMDALFEGIDIWHFVGHGDFDAENPLESALIVWKEGGYDRLSVRSLRTLAMGQSLGFCFLNSCNTGRIPEVPSGEDVRRNGELFVNMAHSLILAGVPIVVATNHEITIEAATRLSRRFYTSVVKYGRRVDQAIREARTELFIGGEQILHSDWSCPVLYARSRLMGLGTEALPWSAPFDLYSIRNVERPATAIARETASNLI